MSRKSGVIGDDRYTNLVCELNEASKVQHFDIGGIKIFFC